MTFLYIIFILAVLQNGLVTTESSHEPLGLIPFPTDSTGNCSKIVSFVETYEVPYMETFKEKAWGIFYKTRLRWNYKLESRRSFRKEYECCHGYRLKSGWKKYVGLYSTCEPICQPECGKGTCMKPNLCFCDFGYLNTISTESDSFACAPACTSPCTNGKCVAPETCLCNSGYKLNENGQICDPVCNVACPTGSFCYKPNQCRCRDGYNEQIKMPDKIYFFDSEHELVNKLVCQPICKKECVHGKCTGPNVCTCDDGYQLDPLNDLFTCLPICEYGCLYGKCTAPNVCTCYEGYSLMTPRVCEPICSEACVMGTCVAPESCSCFTGYGLLESSKYICEPVCEKACLNGQCTVPGVCTCHEGFRLSGDETEKHICKPHCKIPCEPFGVCTAPDICTCFEGYRLANKTQAKKISAEFFNSSVYFANNSICEPICNTECTNGFCSAPGKCSCNAGYHLSSSDHISCEPICSQNCVNSFCSAPETCQCNEGYRPSNSSYVCKPFCETDCINGYCSAPNECTCNSGYQFIEGNRSFCEPICNPNCKNGICVQPNKCNCKPGYRQSTSSNECDPICHLACETNGICEAPDRCVCKDGYRMIYYDKGNVPFECEPICGVECGNGTCTAPDLCACFDGYRNAKIGGCEPVCSTCGNGTCIAPEVCECDDGFVLADPDLGFGVQESRFAVVPENETRNGSRCVPHCENCENGECEAPGECRCHAGFVRIEDTCIHACQGGCGTHGECVEERRTCECDYGWTGQHCDQPTLCVLILNNERNYTEQLTIIEEQNATIEHIFMNNPACSECIGKVNNETLCFKVFVNGTKDETQIGCLMNEECFALSSQYKAQGEMIKLTIGIASGVLLLTAIMTYLILRKRRNSQMDLGSIPIVCRHNTSTQGLFESNPNL